MFYVYVYLDTRKPGVFQYGDYLFDHEPFYVGKGTGYRSHYHIELANRNCTDHKSNKIRKILNETGDYPTIIRVLDNLVESVSLEMECLLISLIGREDKGLGPLLNKTDGGDGVSGLIHSEETKSLIREKRKLQPPSFTKTHSVETRLVLSEKTRLSMTPERRAQISKEASSRVLTESTRHKISVGNLGKEPRAKLWTILYPTGETVSIKNLLKFCEETFGSQARSYNLLKRGNQYNGYTAYRGASCLI